MGNSADRAWRLSQLVEGVSTAFNPSHGSLSYVQAGHCVSKQIGRHDAACQGCPQRVSRSPVLGPRKAGGLCGERRSSVGIELSCLHGSERYAACFDEVVARAVRVSQPAVLSALLVIQLSGIVIPPPIFLLKSTKRSAAAISRSQRSFITFYGALRNILLSTGFPVMFHMITLKQMFVNNLSQKIFLADAASESNRFYQ